MNRIITKEIEQSMAKDMNNGIYPDTYITVSFASGIINDDVNIRRNMVINNLRFIFRKYYQEYISKKNWFKHKNLIFPFYGIIETGKYRHNTHCNLYLNRLGMDLDLLIKNMQDINHIIGYGIKSDICDTDKKRHIYIENLSKNTNNKGIIYSFKEYKNIENLSRNFITSTEIIRSE